MSEREKVTSGGALSKREMTVTLVDDDASIAELIQRLQNQLPLALQIQVYFYDLERRLREIPGVHISPNLKLVVPWGPFARDANSLMAEEFSELREALFEIVLDDKNKRWVPRIAPHAQLTAVARAHFAGQLAKTRNVLPKEPPAERGIRDDALRANARGAASAAKRSKAGLWKGKAIEVARAMIVPTKLYSAKDVAPEVWSELATWLPAEYNRLGLRYNPRKDLPAVDTVRKAIPASKIVGKIR